MRHPDHNARQKNQRAAWLVAQAGETLDRRTGTLAAEAEDDSAYYERYESTGASGSYVRRRPIGF